MNQKPPTCESRRVSKFTNAPKSTVEPSIQDTLGPERTVLIIEMSSFQGLRLYYGKAWRVIWFQWHVSTKEGFLQFRGLDERGSIVFQNVYYNHHIHAHTHMFIHHMHMYMHTSTYTLTP